MDPHTPGGAQPICITDQPLDLQLIDLRLACSPHDPDLHVLCVAVWVDLGHDRTGADPALMPLDRVWSPPTPLDESARLRWLEISTVARDLFDVRPHLAAEVDRLTDDIVALTVWPVAEAWAPGVRRAVVTNGMLRSDR